MCELAAAVLELLNTNRPTYQRDMRIIVMQIILLLLLQQNIACNGQIRLKYCTLWISNLSIHAVRSPTNFVKNGTRLVH